MGYSSSARQAAELEEVEEGLLRRESQDDAFLEKSTNVERSGRPWVLQRGSWIIQWTMLACSSTLFIFSRYSESSDAACIQKMFPYSPAFEAVTYHEETLAGAFLQPSPYRGSPTPEIDFLWEEIADGNAFNVAEDKIHLLNKSTSSPLYHTDPEFGGGVAAQLWGFHQLHCLNLLRQISYRDTYEKTGRLPEILRVDDRERRDHLDHCIEVVRLDMMCNADVTPYFVMEPMPGSPPGSLAIDFSVFKKCRDFGKIKEWSRNNVAIKSFKDSFVEEAGNLK